MNDSPQQITRAWIVMSGFLLLGITIVTVRWSTNLSSAISLFAIVSGVLLSVILARREFAFVSGVGMISIIYVFATLKIESVTSGYITLVVVMGVIILLSWLIYTRSIIVFHQSPSWIHNLSLWFRVGIIDVIGIVTSVVFYMYAPLALFIGFLMILITAISVSRRKLEWLSLPESLTMLIIDGVLLATLVALV